MPSKPTGGSSKVSRMCCLIFYQPSDSAAGIPLRAPG